MKVETTQLKLAKSQETGELIGFVTEHSYTKKLMGVREFSGFKKRICILARELKGLLEEDKLYEVELKAMHKRAGYIIVSAKPMLFEAEINTFVIPHKIYQVRVTFGNKTIYFDPKDGTCYSSLRIDGVIGVLRRRDDIAQIEVVVKRFREHAAQLIAQMQRDGYTYNNV